MWIITTVGFFSIVRKGKEPVLTVRARRLEDLDRLKAKYLPSLAIEKRRATVDTDYPFRGTVDQTSFAMALADMALSIDYPNFKDAAKAEQGADVGQVYMTVWSDLMKLERPNIRKAKQARIFGYARADNRIG